MGPTCNGARDVLRKISQFKQRNRGFLTNSDLNTLQKWSTKLEKLISCGEQQGHFKCCPLSEYFPGLAVDVTDSCECCTVGFIELRLIAWQKDIQPGRSSLVC